LAQSRVKDIEEKEEAARHRKAPQPLYDQLKVPDESVADFQVGSSFDTHAALLAGANTDAQRSDLAMHLQKTYGNRYVQRLVESAKVQAKLTVGSPDDEYEREADRVADAVTRIPASSVQRQVEPEEEEEEEEEPVVEVQTKTSLIQRQEEEIAAKPASEIEHSAAPVLQRQKDIPGGPEEPPKTTKDPKEALTQSLKAGLKTDLGKKVIKTVFGKGLPAEAAKAAVGTFVDLGLNAAFAKKMGYPQAAVDLIPKLVKYEVGKNMVLALQPILKGPLFKKPKKWGAMLTFTIKRW
jgi:hypothetical protein